MNVMILISMNALIDDRISIVRKKKRCHGWNADPHHPPVKQSAISQSLCQNSESEGINRELLKDSRMHTQTEKKAELQTEGMNRELLK
ncbi:hypothetical protein E3N88_27204 [Mikania micrantha]|uniref:Uncharacterized protein n=1 Tax=Mikania micrantha TaxID=192012 RepID=A0A5N6MVZ8_9ASTR|nr:hypothetical protein E3N88_27204 [Mikania micrantha]